jgi:hypothetical protein
MSEREGKMFVRWRTARYLAGMALVAALSGCGSGTPTSNSTPPTPTPTPLPAPRVVSQGSTDLAVGYAYGVTFDVSPTGTIDATVDYTYADTLLLVWIAKGQCSPEQFNNDQCQFVASSVTGGKPRRVSATGQTAGTYTLIVGSLGPKVEAISYQIVFSATAASAAPPMASARRPSVGSFLVRLPSPAPGL